MLLLLLLMMTLMVMMTIKTTMTTNCLHDFQPWTMNAFGLFTSVVAFYLLAPEPYLASQDALEVMRVTH